MEEDPGNIRRTSIRFKLKGNVYLLSSNNE